MKNILVQVIYLFLELHTLILKKISLKLFILDQVKI